MTKLALAREIKQMKNEIKRLINVLCYFGYFFV